jgi:hypothetical protein
MKKYYLSIASIFKNESWGMREWLEHYKFHGVDHIYLVNDFSTDDYMSILSSYIEDGFVTLYHNDNSERYTGRQIDINNKFFKPIVNETQWIANLDLDEFLYSPKGIDLKTIFQKYESYACITANWVWFNSNGHVKQPSSIVHSFTKRCEYDRKVYMKSPGNSFFEWIELNAPKVILNSDFNISSFNIHSASISGNIINVSTQSMSDDPELLINHYQLQSREYWEKIKMNRGDVNHWFKGSSRDFGGYESMDVGDIDDFRLSDQNKEIYK